MNTDQTKPDSTDGFSNLVKVGILRQLFTEELITEETYRELLSVPAPQEKRQ